MAGIKPPGPLTPPTHRGAVVGGVLGPAASSLSRGVGGGAGPEASRLGPLKGGRSFCGVVGVAGWGLARLRERVAVGWGGSGAGLRLHACTLLGFFNSL